MDLDPKLRTVTITGYPITFLLSVSGRIDGSNKIQANGKERTLFQHCRLPQDIQAGWGPPRSHEYTANC